MGQIMGIRGLSIEIQNLQLALKNPAIPRRDFIAGVAGLAGLSIIGCRSESRLTDSESRPFDTDSPRDAAPPLDMASSRDAALPVDAELEGSPDSGKIPQSFVIEARFLQITSRFPSDLTHYKNILIGINTLGGTDTKSELLQFDPSSPEQPIASTNTLPLPDTTPVPSRFFSQFAPLKAGRGIVNANDGFYEVNRENPNDARFIPYPSGIDTGGGAVFAPNVNKLFLATAQLTGFGYGPGKIVVYDVDGNGRVVEGNPRFIETTDPNPTGLALRKESQLVVLNSGDFSGSGSRPSIDMIDVASETILRNHRLPDGRTVQVSGDIALSDDGNDAIIGTSDNSGLVFRINMESGERMSTTLEGTGFHSSVKRDGGIAYLTDFTSGTVKVLRQEDLSLISSLTLFSSGEAGPSAIFNGMLIQLGAYGAAAIIPQY